MAPPLGKCFEYGISLAFGIYAFVPGAIIGCLVQMSLNLAHRSHPSLTKYLTYLPYCGFSMGLIGLGTTLCVYELYSYIFKNRVQPEKHRLTILSGNVFSSGFLGISVGALFGQITYKLSCGIINNYNTDLF